MPRLFTALEIPADVAAPLALVRGGLPGARWIEPESYHLTLRFIGDIDHAMARDVYAALEDVRSGPVSVSFSGLAVFGGSKPRAIIMAAHAAPALMALQVEQEHLMRRIVLPPEARKFTPHVTLARLRQTTPQAVGAFLAAHGLIAVPPIPAARFGVFSARGSIGGGPYVAEAFYPLA